MGLQKSAKILDKASFFDYTFKGKKE